jgi:hypothetical protein
VLAWFAGWRSGRVQLTALHEGVAVEVDDDTGWGVGYNDDTLSRRYRADTGGYRRVGTDSDFSGLYRPDSGGSRRPRADSEASGRYQADTGGFEEVDSDTGYGFYRTDTDLRPVVNGAAELPLGDPVPGVIETGDILPVTFDVFKPVARGSDAQQDETARLYGQIAIYTLIDGQAEEFDRLAQAVVERVKALEPDTLAYIVHGVPSAPLQRILYEVYRDDAAFEEHGQAALHPGLRGGAQTLRPRDQRDRARRAAGEALAAGWPVLPTCSGWPARPAPAGLTQPAPSRPAPAEPAPAPTSAARAASPAQQPRAADRPARPARRAGSPAPSWPGSFRQSAGSRWPGGRSRAAGRPAPPGRGGVRVAGRPAWPSRSAVPWPDTGPPGAGRPDPYGRPGPHGRPGGSAAFPAPPDGESPRSWSNGIQ